MRSIDWTSILIAVTALVGTIYTAWRSQGRKDRATLHVERADHVVGLQAAEMKRLNDELVASRRREEALEAKLEEMESALASVSGRVTRLESEILRLGGDPGLVM